MMILIKKFLAVKLEFDKVFEKAVKEVEIQKHIMKLW